MRRVTIASVSILLLLIIFLNVCASNADLQTSKATRITESTSVVEVILDAIDDMAYYIKKYYPKVATICGFLYKMVSKSIVIVFWSISISNEKVKKIFNVDLQYTLFFWCSSPIHEIHVPLHLLKWKCWEKFQSKSTYLLKFLEFPMFYIVSTYKFLLL